MGKKFKSIFFGHFFTMLIEKRPSKILHLHQIFFWNLMIFFSCQKKAYFRSKSDICSKIDVQMNLTG